MFETIRKSIPPIHKDGYVFFAIFLAATLVLSWLWDPLGWVGLILSAWCLYFFRDPNRYVPQKDGLIISPADGIVSSIVKTKAPAELDLDDEEMTRVSIFLNVFNVHVQRAPIAGKIEKIDYHPGKFLNASLDKASDDNERNSLVIETNEGKKIVVVQIAGLIARRIVCDAKEGQQLEAGERYGIIRFGSRVDVYLPKGVSPLVAVGQTAVGGETIIANLDGKTKARDVKKI
jgi:phosphatidylserine decarboxylase